MDRERLKQAILEALGQRPRGALELSADLDEDPTLILALLKELEAEERVIEFLPLGTVYSRLE